MTQQRLHSQLAPIDVLTREEMAHEMTTHMDAFLRERYRGLEIQRFPVITAIATGGTLNLGATGNDMTPCGPEQGDIWMVRRVIVKSNSFSDTAKYILFRGSTPSDAANAYGVKNLLEGFSPTIPAPAPSSQPAVPASGVAVQNTNQFPVQVVLSGFTATQVFVNGIQVGTGNGTYTVPANGAISVTYTVAGTWVWSNVTVFPTAMGQNVNLGYYPGTKALFLQPGEQIYAQISSVIPAAIYQLDGEAIRVPAEMKGKIL